MCPPLSSTHQKTSSINSAARLRQNLDLMISSLTPTISRQMSDKCPHIHQAFPPQLVFPCSCRPYINAVVSNRLNICVDVGGGGVRRVLGVQSPDERPSTTGSTLSNRGPLTLDSRGLDPQNSGPRHDLAANAANAVSRSCRRRRLLVVSIHHVTLQEFTVNST